MAALMAMELMLITTLRVISRYLHANLFHFMITLLQLLNIYPARGAWHSLSYQLVILGNKNIGCVFKQT